MVSLALTLQAQPLEPLPNDITVTTNKPLANSVLWKVEHSAMDKPSYLLGTIHAMCSDDFFIPEKVRSVIDQVDEISFEVNLSDPAEMGAVQKAMMSEIKLSEKLSERQLDKLNELLQSKIGIGIEHVDSYTMPTILALFIGSSLPCTLPKSYEMELMSIALEKGISISGLETVEQQYESLNNSMTDDQYIEQIELFDDYKKSFDAAFEYYKSENIEAVSAEYVNDRYMDENGKYWSLNVRNARWVNKLPDMIKTKSTLVAVGAAHLVGEIGLIQELRKLGYTVTPIF